MKTVLLTGGSGFIGSRLLPLLARNYRVVSLGRAPLKNPLNAVEVHGNFCVGDDLRRLDNYAVDALVHLAAATGGCSEEDGLQVNVVGSRRLLRYLLDRGCRKFVLAGSIAATGCLRKTFVPLSVPIADDHPCLAADAYGWSKAMLEELARFFALQYPDADITCLRPGPVFDEAVWKPLRVRAGDALWGPFAQLARVAAADVIRAFELVLAAQRPGLRRYNVVGPEASCDDPPADILGAALGAAAAGLDFSAYRRPGHAYDPVFAIDTIKTDLGYVPAISPRPAKFSRKET